jgi:hypothetical protein
MFDKIIEDTRTLMAYKKLVDHGMRFDLLDHWLLEIPGMSNVPPKSSYDRDQITSLTKKCRGLAFHIERGLEAGKIPPVEVVAGVPATTPIATYLRLCADAWESTATRNQTPEPLSPQANGVLNLLWAVREFTKSFHYPEVAQLLNTTFIAHGKASEWDFVSLRQRRYRYSVRIWNESKPPRG